MLQTRSGGSWHAGASLILPLPMRARFLRWSGMFCNPRLALTRIERYPVRAVRISRVMSWGEHSVAGKT